MPRATGVFLVGAITAILVTAVMVAGVEMVEPQMAGRVVRDGEVLELKGDSTRPWQSLGTWVLCSVVGLLAGLSAGLWRYTSPDAVMERQTRYAK